MTTPNERIWANWASALNDEALAAHLNRLSRNIRSFGIAQRAAILHEATKRLSKANDPSEVIEEQP